MSVTNFEAFKAKKNQKEAAEYSKAEVQKVTAEPLVGETTGKSDGEGDGAEQARAQLLETMRKNEENRIRMKAERQKDNKGVIKSYKLKT